MRQWSAGVLFFPTCHTHSSHMSRLRGLSRSFFSFKSRSIFLLHWGTRKYTEVLFGCACFLNGVFQLNLMVILPFLIYKVNWTPSLVLTSKHYIKHLYYKFHGNSRLDDGWCLVFDLDVLKGTISIITHSTMPHQFSKNYGSSLIYLIKEAIIVYVHLQWTEKLLMD